MDFRDTAYWSNADAGKRKKFLFFREMLRVCLHPSLTNRMAGDILQTMQAALHDLAATPLFADAADILTTGNTAPASPKAVNERIKAPFTCSLAQALFVNTTPWQGADAAPEIICTSVQNYMQVAAQLTATEQTNVGLADIAASPLFLYELTQPDLFRPTAANEATVRRVAAKKYPVIVAALPYKRHLPISTYSGKDFLVAWLQALERLLLPKGAIYLSVGGNFLTGHKWQSLRQYLVNNFDSIRAFRLPEADDLLTIVLQHAGKVREFFTNRQEPPEKLLINAESNWLAASECPFFEGIPLSEALDVKFRIVQSDNQLLIKFDEFPEDVSAAITDTAREYLKQHYKFEEQYEQERALLAETAQELTDTDELQQCRVHPELGQELRRWVQWAESKDAVQFVKKIEKPDFVLAKQFASIARLFGEIERKFERMGEKAALDKDSMAMLRQWFERQAAAIASVGAFFDRPDFDAPLRSISKTDVFYYIFALVQSEDYLRNFRHVLRHSEPRVYATNDFWTWVDAGAEQWKQYRQSI
ncbi:type ISP restriction/modification enzyme [Rhodoflexus caldus]|uniref:type ISP restriction/modification enzyme n=1 Tax=Rhodoflexus caldus TaxID=2891236 RepID=UPI00202A2384|nr:type ISP restriction/modification enzyme [Rhodoflexus caldus]